MEEKYIFFKAQIMIFSFSHVFLSDSYVFVFDMLTSRLHGESVSQKPVDQMSTSRSALGNFK